MRDKAKSYKLKTIAVKTLKPASLNLTRLKPLMETTAKMTPVTTMATRYSGTTAVHFVLQPQAVPSNAITSR